MLNIHSRFKYYVTLNDRPMTRIRFNCPATRFSQAEKINIKANGTCNITKNAF